MWSGKEKEKAVTLVLNEMTGKYNDVDDVVVSAYIKWKNLETYWHAYAKNVHDPTNLLSVTILMGLQQRMDGAWEEFRPFQNYWLIATKGISLN